LSEIVKNNRYSTIAEITHEYNKVALLKISERTIQRLISKLGFHPYKPISVLYLDEKHKEMRLKWAHKYINWTFENWKNICFTDEVTFILGNMNRPPYVWRQKNEITLDLAYVECKKIPQIKVIFWGYILSNGDRGIEPIHEKMNAEAYIRILDIVGPMLKERSITLMDDNAPFHRTGNIKKKKKSLGIKTIEWPPVSPDLNPIENMWAFLKKAVSRKYQCGVHLDRDSLISIVKEEFEEISKDTVINFYKGMETRVQKLMEFRGGRFNKKKPEMPQTLSLDLTPTQS